MPLSGAFSLDCLQGFLNSYFSDFKAAPFFDPGKGLKLSQTQPQWASASGIRVSVFGVIGSCLVGRFSYGFFNAFCVFPSFQAPSQLGWAGLRLGLGVWAGPARVPGTGPMAPAWLRAAGCSRGEISFGRRGRCTVGPVGHTFNLTSLRDQAGHRSVALGVRSQQLCQVASAFMLVAPVVCRAARGGLHHRAGLV